MNNQAFSKIWVVIILIILIAGGIFAWQYFGAPKETEMLEKEAVKDETADWETYRNEEYGFEIKYYPTYNVKERPTPREVGLHHEEVLKEIDFHINDFPNLTLRVFPNDKKLSIEDFLAEFYEFPQKEFSKARFLEIQTKYGVRAFYPTGETVDYLGEFYRQKGIIGEMWGGIYQLWFIGTQNYIFMLNLWQDSVEDHSGYSLRELANQMLSTFRFLE